MRKNLATVDAKRGFTLIELILYVAIVSIFITSAIQFGWNVIYGRVKHNVIQEVNNNMRFVTKRVDFEIRNASAVNSVTATSISLASPDSARNPTVIDLSSGRVRIGFGASGSCPTTTPCPLTPNEVTATALTFTNISGGGNFGSDTLHIRFTITLASVNPSGRSEWDRTETITSSAELRSH